MIFHENGIIQIIQILLCILFRFQFFCILLIGVVGEAAAVWWGAAHGGHLVQQVRSTVDTTVRSEYDGKNSRTDVFDLIQKEVNKLPLLFFILLFILIFN